jgi:3-hydroxybutyryl-CoA dehydrogenase
MKQLGIVGAGAMGSGIAQVAAQSGVNVILYDLSVPSLEKAETQLKLTLRKLVEKGKLNEAAAKAISDRISTTDQLTQLAPCSMIIEAIIENLEVKKKLFQDLEQIVDDQCILASNTSSLSITALSSACRIQSRVIGLHFFNPAPLMPLVEIIPALQTDKHYVPRLTTLMLDWGKTPVTAKDTPGFIVNRVARPFYSEGLRIYEEGLANMAQIDAAMRHIGFRMGPFELMDLIGNDINYSVTKSVFEMFYFDPRYRPSLTQLKHVEAGWLGKKSKRGYYDYQTEWQPIEHNTAYTFVHERILTMLINEAYDAHYMQVANADDLDLAMTKGVNYPKGLMAWGKEIGLETIQERMDRLYQTYREDRYRTSPGISHAMRSII